MFRSEEEKIIEMNTMSLATLKIVVNSLCKFGSTDWLLECNV